MEEGPPAATPEALFARWRGERDPEALGALFDGAAPGLFLLALTLVPDAATAEDALQETFLFAMEEPDRWDPARPVVPWLAGILRLKVLEARRRNAREPRPERVRRPPPPDDPLLQAADAEERERVRVALLELEEPYREAALLRWRYGLEPAEIAEVKGVPPGTVSSWLHRAVEKLRVEMGALPAVLAVAFPERGLASIRQAFLHAAFRHAVASGVTAAAVKAASAEAAAVAPPAALKTWGLIAAGVLVLAGGTWFSVHGGGSGTKGSAVPGFTSHGGASPALPASPPMKVAPFDGSAPALGTAIPAIGTATVRGRCILRSGGTPVAGASVRVGGAGTVTTDAAGRFVVAGIPPSDSPLLTVEARGLATLRTGLFPLRAGTTVDLGDVGLGTPASLRVAVRTTEGRPVPGATVRAWSKEWPNDGSTLLLGWDLPGIPSPPVTSAETGVDGIAVMADLAPGGFQLRAEAPGFARSAEVGASTADAGKELSPVEILLEPAATVEGRVLEGTSETPVPGAEVAAWRMWETPSTLAGGPVRALAGADGRFRLEGVPAGALIVAARRRPEGIFAATRQATAPATAIDLGLPGDGSVEGVAFDAVSGAPIAGADLDVFVHPASPGLMSGSFTSVRTTGDGSFRADGLPLGARVQFAPRIGGPWCPPPLDERALSTESVKAVPVSGIRVPLCRAGAIAGTVREPGGKAAAGAEVVLMQTRARFHNVSVNGETARIQAGEDGRFLFEGVGPGTPKVVARSGLGSSAETEVTVEPGRTTTADLSIGGGLIVSGRLVDEGGAPVAGRVYTYNRFLGQRQVGFLQTDAEGRFTLTGIPLETPAWLVPSMGADLVLAADGPAGYGHSDPIPAKAGVPVEGVVIRLVSKESRTASIAGRVCAPDGAALPGARLVLDINNRNRNLDEKADLGVLEPHGTPVPVASDGSFRIEGIDTTHHDTVALIGLAPGWFPRRTEVKVAGGGTTGEVRIELRAGLELRGRLLQADGSPAAGVPVQALPCPEGSYPSSGAPAQAVTAPDGTFSIRPMGKGHLSVNFGRDPMKPIHRVNGVWAEEGPLEARIPAKTALRGRALEADGTPAAGVPVRWVSAGGPGGGSPPEATRTAADGTFTIEDAPPGPFSLWIGDAFPAGEPSPFLVKRTPAYPAGTASVEVVLERGLFIEGTALDAEGKPVEGAGVSVLPEDPSGGFTPGFRSTGPDGAFREGPLPVGAYRLTVSYGDTSVEREGVAAGTKYLRLRLTDEGTIRGRVLDAAGEPVASVRISLTHVSGRGSFGTGGQAGADGRFSLAAVKDRAYVLEVEAGAKGSARMESVTGGTRDLVVRLGTVQAGALSGLVLDGEGRPVAGVRVRARTTGAGAGMLEQVWTRPAAAVPDEGPAHLLRQEDLRDALTDAAGAFDFGAMPAGRWVVWAGEPGSPRRPANSVHFEGAGGPVELRVAGGWTLRGRLLDDAGAPRLFITLQVRPRDSLPAPGPSFLITLQTGRGGSFEVPGLPAGPVTVTECNVQPAPSWTIDEQAPGANLVELRPKH